MVTAAIKWKVIETESHEEKAGWAESGIIFKIYQNNYYKIQLGDIESSKEQDIWYEK